MNTEILKAIESMKQIQFHYDGGIRIIEPHCYGITTAGNYAIRGYQVSGHSTSGKMGWKLFDLTKATSITILEATFNSVRPGYNRGDKGMQNIFIEL